MTFSPEDAYASNVPVPDDKQFDTSGLELAPLDGEAAPVEAAPTTEAVYTQEQQAADAELYSVTPKVAEENAKTPAEDPEKVQAAEDKLNSLIQMADSFDPWTGRYDGESSKLKNELKTGLSELSEESQVALAEKVYDNLSSELDRGKMDAKLKLISVLASTTFGQKLRGLEDGRLKGAGYNGLTQI